MKAELALIESEEQNTKGLGREEHGQRKIDGQLRERFRFFVTPKSRKLSLPSTYGMQKLESDWWSLDWVFSQTRRKISNDDLQW